MARKCHHWASFSVENLFFDDYLFGSLMTDVFLDWFWTLLCTWKPPKQESPWNFWSRLKILGAHCVLKSRRGMKLRVLNTYLGIWFLFTSVQLNFLSFLDTGPHISGLLWAFLLVSAAIVITLPTKMAIQSLGTSFILRMIVSLGPEFTLTVLALALVSILFTKSTSINHFKGILILCLCSQA